MSDPVNTPLVRLDRWAESDLDLLFAMNAPEMTAHLGGPETEEQVRARHQRYLAMDPDGPGCMFRVVLQPEEVPVGGIGYWTKVWRGGEVYETGWLILPPYQGRGLASAAATAVAAKASAAGRYRYLHAFPSTGNAASNAVCRKAGFTFLAEHDFEYPPGNPMRCNDWRLDLAMTENSSKAAREAV